MRVFLILAIAACAGNAGAQIVSRDSLHLKPVGTAVSGSFVLVNRTIPLPQGEYVLAAVEPHDSRFVRGDFSRQQHKMVDVALAQMEDGKLSSYVWASAVLKIGGQVGWVTEPCKTSETPLYKLSRVPFMKTNYEQNCLIVNHRAGLGTQSTGACRSKLRACSSVTNATSSPTRGWPKRCCMGWNRPAIPCSSISA